jgi:hypothetical protein
LGTSANGSVLTSNISGARIWSNSITLSNLTVSSTNTGNIYANTHFGNVVADRITPYQTAITVFNSNTAVGIPIGNTTQRPTASTGYLRFNTDQASLEFYNGAQWTPLTNVITDQQITPDGIANVFTLNQSAAQEGIFVSLNGVMQLPGVSYTVSGNQITFAEVPRVTDIVDIRFVSTLNLITALSGNLSVVGNISVAGNSTVTGGKLQTVPAIVTGNVTLGTAYMGGILEIGGTLPYTVNLPNPVLYQGQITMWLNASGTLTVKTPAGVIYVNYGGTTSGSGTNTVTIANNNTNLFTLMADGYNWSIWGVKTA